MKEHIAFPFAIDDLGRTALAGDADHVRQLIAQVLFTAPGERVNRPGFGCGLRRLVFSPQRNELSTAIETILHGSLQQWLGDVIQVQAVEIQSQENTLQVDVRYIELRTRESRYARFTG
jgi:phage baseplate assembly protein W